MSNAENITLHIIAALVGVIFSLSIVYKRLESRFSIHRQIAVAKVRMVEHDGVNQPEASAAAMVAAFNQLTFIDRKRYLRVSGEPQTTFHFHDDSEIRLWIADPFVWVGRRSTRGSWRYYRVIDKTHSLQGKP